jgi:hypothetical protein
VRIGATRKTDLHRVAHDRTGAVATGDERGFYDLDRPVGPAQARHYPRSLVLKANEFCGVLDLDTQRSEPVTQYAFMLVLRKHKRIWERTDALAHLAKNDASFRLPGDPQVYRFQLAPATDDLVGEIDLIVEFEDTRMHRKRARRRSRFVRLVDYADLDAKMG